MFTGDPHFVTQIQKGPRCDRSVVPKQLVYAMSDPNAELRSPGVSALRDQVLRGIER